MQIPKLLIHSLQDITGFDEEAFIHVHESGEQVTSIRINPNKVNYGISLFENTKQVSWSRFGYYLPNRPSFTFDPLFHAGCYYVQEASSMFLEEALKQTVDLLKPVKILDLCAAPGGKSSHLQSLISKDSLLVSNEVIRQRSNILKDNIIKWGTNNVLVSNNDPKDFSKLHGYFDILVIDAPCSGSGLFRRDKEAINEWSENNVMLCCSRQRRILADALPSLKENGILIYSTCSYSKEEDEEILDWLITEFELENLQLTLNEEWGITEIKTEKENFGYRFWPYKLKGEGFFLSVFKKTASEKPASQTKSKLKLVSKKQKEIFGNWVNPGDSELVIFGNTVYAWPKNLVNDYDFLAQHLKTIYSGTALGSFAHDKFIPDHSLAMSNLYSEKVIKTELSKENAIAYLQRKDFEATIALKGMQIATFNNYPLGWMNVLQNRINNYYPKELRILKDKI